MCHHLNVLLPKVILHFESISFSVRGHQSVINSESVWFMVTTHGRYNISKMLLVRGDRDKEREIKEEGGCVVKDG